MKKALSVLLCLCVLCSVFVFVEVSADASTSVYLKVGEIKTIYGSTSDSNVAYRRWSLDSNAYGFVELLSSNKSYCTVRAIDYAPLRTITLRAEVDYLRDYGYFTTFTEEYSLNIERPELTVYFNANGGKVSQSSANVMHSESLGTSLPTPTRKGYIFNGWYTQKKGGKKILSSTPITSGGTIYARWIKIKTNKVIFNAMGGKASKSSRKIKTGEAVGNLPTAKRKGYILNGWYTKSKGGKKINSAKKITSDTTFYAHWSKSVKVTYQTRGGTLKTKSKVFKKGAKIGKLPTPKRKNYYFDGWFTKAKNGKKIKTSTKFKRNKNIYAHWTAQVRVSFNPTGGTVKTKHKTFRKGKAIGKLPTPVREGCTFINWYTEKSGGKKVTSSYKFKKSTTIYARWLSKVTVTFNPTGGTVGTDKVILKNGKSIGALPEPTREGFKFLGWYTSETSSKAVTASDTFTKDTVLLACWQGETDDYIYTTRQRTATILKYIGNEANVTIPDELDGREVAVLDDFSFEQKTNLIEVTLPFALTRIGDNAFRSCINLKNVYFNTLTLKTIGSNAFFNCENLKSVDIVSLDVESIGKNAFGYYRDPYTKVPDFIVYGFYETEAERYAKENGFKFILLNYKNL